MFYINLDIDREKRFDMSKFLSFEESVYSLHDSYLLREIPKLKKRGEFTVTVQETRPWLISYEIYGDVQYWWALMIYNNIVDFTSIDTGDSIDYFTLDDLDALFYDLRRKQLAEENIG